MKPISARIIERGARVLTIETLRAQCEIVTIDTDSDGVESHPDDDLLLLYLDAAVAYAERFTGRSVALRTYEFALDDFPRRTIDALFTTDTLQPGIEVPYPPLLEVISFTYTDDSDGELDETTDYTIDAYGDKAVLRPVSTWPILVTPVANRVKVRYRAGYSSEVEPDSDAEPLEPAVRHALLLYVETAYGNRGTVPQDALDAIEMILRPLRVLTGMA
jgi:hypothetical protein